VLDIALAKFIGAGLTSFAPLHNLQAPKAEMSKPVELLRLLNKWQPKRTIELVTAAASQIHHEGEHSGVSETAGLQHVLELPSVLCNCSPDKDLIISAVSLLSSHTNPDDEMIKSQARRISLDIIDKARNKNVLKRNNLRNSVSCFFIEALYFQILQRTSFLNDARPVFEQYLMTNCRVDPGDPSQIHTHACKGQTVKTGKQLAMLPSPVAMPQAQAKSEVNGSSISETLADYISVHAETPLHRTDILRLCYELFAELEHLNTQQPGFSDLYDNVCQHLKNNALDSAGTTLDASEADFIESISDQAARPEIQARLRCIKGLIAYLRFKPRRASRYFASAITLSPHDNYELRWKLIRHQIESLVWHGQENGELTAIDNAIKICSSAVTVLHQPNCAAYHMDAQAVLGQILILDGEYHLPAERYSAASKHLRIALTYYEQNGPKQAVFKARFGLAQALSGLGQRTSDQTCIEEAIQLYKDLLQSDAANFGFQGHITTCLGLALAHLHQQTKNADTQKASSHTLRSGLRLLEDTPPSRRNILLQGRANAALAHQLASESQQDAALNQEASALFRLALSNLQECGAVHAAEQLRRDMTAFGIAHDDIVSKDTCQAHQPGRAGNARPSPDQHIEATEEADGQSQDGANGYLFRLRASMREAEAEKQKNKRRLRLFG